MGIISYVVHIVNLYPTPRIYYYYYYYYNEWKWEAIHVVSTFLGIFHFSRRVRLKTPPYMPICFLFPWKNYSHSLVLFDFQHDVQYHFYDQNEITRLPVPIQLRPLSPLTYHHPTF